ncbi:MAG: SRPBCC family protein [Acidobacteriia bacterium]|nr:SRPBCC family protein [Terriglobia bacterium]
MATSQMDRVRQARLGEALGYLSIGLGVAEIAAPRLLSGVIGAPPSRPWLLRGMGIREVANGLGILAQPRQAEWMWARVVGDAVDLGLLGLAFTSHRANGLRLIAATAAVAGVTALDVFRSMRLCGKRYRHVSPRMLSNGRGARIQRSIAINCTPDRVYDVCRNFSNLPRSIPYLQSVQEMGNKTLRWVARTPAGKAMESTVALIEDRPHQLISWRSLNDDPNENSGSLRISEAPTRRGTILTLELHYKPAADGTGFLDMMLGARADFHAQEALRRLKGLVETGEIPTTKGQTSGRPPGSTSVDQEVGEPLGLRALLAR